MKRSSSLALSTIYVALSCVAQGQGRGGGGMPPAFQENIHDLFAHPELIERTVDLTANGYVAETTSKDPKVVRTLRAHVKQMSGRLSDGRPVRRWDPAFEEFFAHYEAMRHTFTEIEGGINVAVEGTTPEAITAAQNHARIILDFSSQGEIQMHQPHRTLLDEDGGESTRFRGGPPHARRAKLAPTFGATAEEAADTLMKTLGGQLKAALAAGGPESALPICASLAMPLTQQTSQKFDHLTIQRVTDRPRNPANSLDPLDTEVFKHFQTADQAKKPIAAHLRTKADGKTVRFYKPLRISETCLKCHGDRGKMPNQLKTLLDERYPEDRAHGYQLGQLRGLIRVEKAPDAESS